MCVLLLSFSVSIHLSSLHLTFDTISIFFSNNDCVIIFTIPTHSIHLMMMMWFFVFPNHSPLSWMFFQVGPLWWSVCVRVYGWWWRNEAWLAHTISLECLSRGQGGEKRRKCYLKSQQTKYFHLRFGYFFVEFHILFVSKKNNSLWIFFVNILDMLFLRWIGQCLSLT